MTVNREYIGYFNGVDPFEYTVTRGGTIEYRFNVDGITSQSIETVDIKTADKPNFTWYIGQLYTPAKSPNYCTKSFSFTSPFGGGVNEITQTETSEFLKRVVIVDPKFFEQTK